MAKTTATFESQVEQLIGDYCKFFADLRRKTGAAGIELAGLPLIQLLFRCATDAEYEQLRDGLKPLCREFVETYFNGRLVSILILREALELAPGFEVGMIELPAPRAAHTYPSGLESVGVYIGDELPAFKKRHAKALTGVKDHGHDCKPAFVTFDNGKTIKFYDHTLRQIVLLEGWRFEQLDEPAEAEVNRVAGMVNAWRKYLYTKPDWQALIRRVEPKMTGCGPVYEVPNPIRRPGESFAIADMRSARFTDVHYHHRMTEIYMVLEGHGTVVVGGQPQTVRQDATVVIPPDTAHFTLPQGLVLAAINTPPFDATDYLVLKNSAPELGFDKVQYDRMVKEANSALL